MDFAKGWSVLFQILGLFFFANERKFFKKMWRTQRSMSCQRARAGPSVGTKCLETGPRGTNSHGRGEKAVLGLGASWVCNSEIMTPAKEVEDGWAKFTEKGRPQYTKWEDISTFAIRLVVEYFRSWPKIRTNWVGHVYVLLCGFRSRNAESTDLHMQQFVQQQIRCFQVSVEVFYEEILS